MKVYIAMYSYPYEGSTYIKACKSLELAKLEIKKKCKEENDDYSDEFDRHHHMLNTNEYGNYYYIIIEEIE